MTDLVLPKPAKQARGRPFEKGRSGHPAGRRAGSRNKKTLAAAALLEGESEALTRRAVELALAGDQAALRLCLDRTVAPRRSTRHRCERFRKTGCGNREKPGGESRKYDGPAPQLGGAVCLVPRRD